MNQDLHHLRFPIGEYNPTSPITSDQVSGWIEDITVLPGQLRAVVEPLDLDQLNTPYRPDGWTVQQVVHHVADSHLNSIIRFKWALSEDRPRIKAYDQDGWATLADYQPENVGLSLDLLQAIHARWTVLLRALTDEDLAREFDHPESGVIRLDRNLGLYAWHGRHHLAHITELSVREGW